VQSIREKLDNTATELHRAERDAEQRAAEAQQLREELVQTKGDLSHSLERMCAEAARAAKLEQELAEARKMLEREVHPPSCPCWFAAGVTARGDALGVDRCLPVCAARTAAVGHRQRAKAVGTADGPGQSGWLQRPALAAPLHRPRAELGVVAAGGDARTY
jgi:hypothetical protein